MTSSRNRGLRSDADGTITLHLTEFDEFEVHSRSHWKTPDVVKLDLGELWLVIGVFSLAGMLVGVDVALWPTWGNLHSALFPGFFGLVLGGLAGCGIAAVLQ